MEIAEFTIYDLRLDGILEAISRITSNVADMGLDANETMHQ